MVRVLSLFDGISCGMVALERAGIPVDAYYASEIDKNAIAISQKNYPDRLPEESGMYIVTANDGHAQRVSFVLWQKKNRMWNLTGARSYWMVTHWQPMPEPPKEG